MNKETRNFRWAYSLLIELAKAKLAERNSNLVDKEEWPAGQTWNQLGNTSKSIFLMEAREAAGISHEEFLEGIRDGSYDVDDIWEK